MNQITFKGHELRRALSNAILFTSHPKDMLPALECVRFEWVNDHLFAVATNRYVLSYERIDPESHDGNGAFSISADDAKRIIGILPKQERSPAPVGVRFDTAGSDDRIEVNCLGTVLRFQSANSGTFPRWRAIVDRFEPGEVKGVTFNSKWLASLSKVSDGSKNPLIRFELGEPGKAAHIAIGETFEAMVVPVGV